MGVPWCYGCAHEDKGAFCDPCGKCCMGNEFVKKEEKKAIVMGDFQDRFHHMCDELRAFAHNHRLILYWYTSDEIGKPLPPFTRRFKFRAIGGNYRNITVDFTQIEDDAKAIKAIKSTICKELLIGEPGRGGFTYLTTRNPYMDTDSVYGLTAKLAMVDDILGANKEVNMNRVRIMDVIFNGPATIVIWSDNTKTVVKAQDGEKIDYEKGLAMAISKKFLGNKGNYYDTFEKYLKNAPVVKVDDQDDAKIDFEKDLAMAISKKFSAGKPVNSVYKKKLSKKIEPTDEEIQANSDAVFAEFDEKVKKTRKTVKKDK